MTNTAYQAQAARAAIELLAELFPKCFVVFERRRRPLKVGIHKDLAIALGDDSAITPEELNIALAAYTRNFQYRTKLILGAVRVGLDGEPAGTVSPEDAKGAPKPKPRVTTESALSPAGDKGKKVPFVLWGASFGSGTGSGSGNSDPSECSERSGNSDFSGCPEESAVANKTESTSGRLTLEGLRAAARRRREGTS